MLATEATHPTDELLEDTAKLAAIAYVGPTAPEIKEVRAHLKECSSCMAAVRTKALVFVRSFCGFNHMG